MPNRLQQQETPPVAASSKLQLLNEIARLSAQTEKQNAQRPLASYSKSCLLPTIKPKTPQLLAKNFDSWALKSQVWFGPYQPGCSQENEEKCTI